MKKRVALFLAALMAVMAFMAGCSKPAENPGTNPGNTPNNPAPKAEPQEIVMQMGAEPPNLDSAKTTDTVSFDVLNNAMEGLIRLGKDFEILPGMAEKWDCTPTSTVCTFNLRKGAKWSDGKEVTSKDFAFAWLRALDPNTASDYGYQLHYIKGGQAFNELDVKAADFKEKYEAAKKAVAIETPDDYTLKVTLNAPTPYFLGLMAFPTYLPQRADMVEKHGEKYAADADKMLYNGPFVVKSWTHESEVVLEKNPNYWDAGAVKLTKITWKIVTDANTAVNMFEAGELDEVGLPGDFLPKYKGQPGQQTMAEASTTYISLNQKRREFQNKNLRQAFSLAIDRQTWVDSVLKNGSVPAGGYVPPSIAGDGGKNYRDMVGNLINPKADPAKAKELWEKAKQELGVDKLTVKILHTDSPTTRKYVQGLQAMLQDTLPGLTVDLEAVTFAVRLDRTRKGDFDLVFQGWIGDFNDPMTFMNMFVTGGSYNDPGWSNKEHDDLIKKAETSADNKVRMESMAAAEKILIEEMPIIPLIHSASNWITKPYVKGVLNFPLGGSVDFKNAYVEGKAK